MNYPTPRPLFADKLTADDNVGRWNVLTVMGYMVVKNVTAADRDAWVDAWVGAGWDRHNLLCDRVG